MQSEFSLLYLTSQCLENIPTHQYAKPLKKPEFSKHIPCWVAGQFDF